MRFAYKRPIAPGLRTLVTVVPYISASLYLFNLFMQARKMWVVGDASSQSLSGYLAQALSLTMWLAFYAWATPEQRGAFWTTAASLGGTALVGLIVWSL